MNTVSRRTVLSSAVKITLAASTTALGLSGRAAEALAASWTARWIWPGGGATNQWAAFRRIVHLPAAPSSAVAQIAVDSKYWLYVNDQLVIVEGGLKRGPNPTDTYYDHTDLAPYLKAGDNTIAILAWYFGKDGFSHKNSGKAGLLFQANIASDATTTTVASGADWKATVHPGFGSNSSGGQPNYRLSESNIYYDARNASAMANWQSSAYDDSAWPAATDLAAAGAMPWNTLVQRPIPFFRTSGLLNYTNAASLPTSGVGAITATLPSNLQVTPYLKIEAPAGSVIGVQTDHYTDGGENNVRSTYITAGGVQEFESLGWMSGTSVLYTIPAGVTIHALQYRETGYDTNIVGSFASNETFFNSLWGKAARTMYLNMRDHYLDCPTRERAQWWGDVANQLKQGFYAFDSNSHHLGRKAISELANWQKPNGVLFAPVPAGNWARELPTQMLASISAFKTFYDYTGDHATVGATYPQVKKYLNLWTLDSQGLVAHRAGDWDWEDHGTNIDSRVLDNAWYYLALESAITLARLSGNTGDIAVWQARRDSIKNSFDRVLWNAARNEYRSPGYSGDTDDRGNALAVVAGLADPAHYPAIIAVLRNHQNASPYLEFYVLEALYLMGAAVAAETRMRSRYATQVADPGYTLWELFTGGSGTGDHGWSGGPLYVLSAYAAGLRPTQAGWTTYDVVPQTGSFTNINTLTPTVKGNVSLGVHRVDDKVTMTLDSPDGTTARIGVPTYGGTRAVIKANGTVVYRNDSFTGRVSGLSYVTQDSSYVYFTVQPGMWTLVATGVGRENLALEKPVTSNNSLENADWGAARLTDGSTISVSGAKGYTSNAFASADVSGSPVWVEIDLGVDRPIGSITLYPRTDTAAVGGGSAGFPVDFTIQTRNNSANDYATVHTVTGQPNPAGVPVSYTLTGASGRYLRLQVTSLGTPASDEPTRYRFQLAEVQMT